MMRRFTLVIVFSLLLPGYVRGDEWSIKGNVDQDLGYDDNVLMQRGNQRQGSFKYRIIPVLTFQHKTDVSDVSAHASYGTQLYTDIPRFDQEIQNYGINGIYRTEKIDWDLQTNYSASPTRNTAAQTSGIFNNNSTQNTWSVSPSATFKIDENNSLVLSPSYTETFYTKNSGSAGQNNNFFNDSKSFNINLAWQRLWSERYLTGASFFYNNYESQLRLRSTGTAPSNFDNFGINFSNTYMLSDNWKVAAVIGGRYTESDIGGINTTSVGFLADAAVDYTGENYTAGLHFNRGLIPSSFGQLQEQTSVGINFSYKILERLSTNLSANYQESTTVGSASNNVINNNFGNRTNFVIEPSVSWQLARDWTLGGSYRYRFQDNQNNSGNNAFSGQTDSNLFMISINYNWQGINITR